MEKEIFSTRKIYHLIPDKGDWKIVEEVTNFVPVKEGKIKSGLLKEAISLAKMHKPSRVVIYKSNGEIQEDRNYNGSVLPADTPQIVSELKHLVEGLYYSSESDYLLEIYTLPVEEDLQAELYKISAKPPDSLTEEISFDHFFERYIPEEDMDEQQLKDAKRFLALKQYLAKTLHDFFVVRIGKIQIDIFITGKTTDGNYVILKTTSIET